MKFLRLKEVQAMTSLCRTSIWRMERTGRFPKGHVLPALPTTKVWVESEVLAWMRSQTNQLPDEHALAPVPSAPPIAA